LQLRCRSYAESAAALSLQWHGLQNATYCAAALQLRQEINMFSFVKTRAMLQVLQSIAIPKAVQWASFLPRDAMHKRGLCCRPVSVCLSVRPSVTLVDYIHMAEGIVILFAWPGSHITLVF